MFFGSGSTPSVPDILSFGSSNDRQVNAPARGSVSRWIEFRATDGLSAPRRDRPCRLLPCLPCAASPGHRRPPTWGSGSRSLRPFPSRRCALGAASSTTVLTSIAGLRTIRAEGGPERKLYGPCKRPLPATGSPLLV